MAVEGLVFNKEDGIATITFDRPEKLNAVTEAMRTEVHRIATELRSDDEVKVLIITGAGEAFSTGADASELTADYSGPIEPYILKRPLGWWTLPVRYFPKPTIAAIPGVVAGVTFSLALACDFRFASDKARFSMVFIKRGLVPDGGATYYLPRMVGTSKALELMLMGDTIDANEAERLGLVNRVVPHEELMKVTREFAARIASGPSVAIELIKKGVYKGAVGELEAQLDFETLAQRICFQTEDFKEGIASFLEKRQPKFKGR
ncbi:MAG: enoyl-CoA hydratase [Dehalococcoidia bacterium]|nr:MAG: enoyl-CoA hydratase [Dehalococcoidia bacterium]